MISAASQPDPARLFGHIDRAKAEFRAALDRVAREDVFFVPFRRMGRDLVGGEPLGDLADRKLVFGELKLSVHGGCSSRLARLGKERGAADGCGNLSGVLFYA